MRKWLMGFLIITTIAAMAFSYIFFSRNGWDGDGWSNEANPIARWLFSNLGLELSFFVVLPIYFILFYWIIYYYYPRIGTTLVSKYFFIIFLTLACLLKAYDVAVWIWLYLTI